ncbi:MAG: hypothetical protein ACD_79C00053G0001, partial [uncultured bacterium]
GVLYSMNESAPFIFGGAMSFIAVLILILFVKEKRLN